MPGIASIIAAKRSLVLVVLVQLAAVVPMAEAQEPAQVYTPLLLPAPPQPGSPFDIKLALDLPIVFASGALALGSELAKSELPGPACGLSCDATQINALDRTVIGNRSAEARVASDVLVGLSMGLPIALDLIDVLATKPADGMRGFGKDFLIFVELFAVTSGLGNLVKFAVRRPRPLAYDVNVDPAERSEPDAALSFYSNHSATSFAMATAYSYLFMLRHPGSKLIVPVWLISEGMAAATAYLRVHAGRHFYTDVLAGALVGSALGLLIPYLHRRIARSTSPSGVATRSHFHVLATPSIFSDGAGIVVSLSSER